MPENGGAVPHLPYRTRLWFRDSSHKWNKIQPLTFATFLPNFSKLWGTLEFYFTYENCIMRNVSAYSDFQWMSIWGEFSSKLHLILGMSAGFSKVSCVMGNCTKTLELNRFRTSRREIFVFDHVVTNYHPKYFRTQKPNKTAVFGSEIARIRI